MVPPPGLGSVDHQVVRHGPALGRFAFQTVHILPPRRSKRVMHRIPPLLVFVPLKHGKLDDPREVHASRVVQLQFGGQTFAQGGQGLAGNFPRVGDEQQQIARFRLQSLADLRQQRVVEVLGDRRPQRPVLLDAEPDQALGTEIQLDPIRQFVEPFSRELARRAFGVDAAHPSARHPPFRGRRGIRLPWPSSVQSVNSIPKRKSGASWPNRSIASS